MTKAEQIERYGIEWYEEYQAKSKAKCKARYANDPEYREYQIERNMKYYSTSNTCKEQHRLNSSEYRKKDLTKDGKLKNNIRFQSNYILFKQRKHTKLKDYEIHHAFGYEDPSKFIYIPRSLHKAIHSFLKENNINADTDHYKYISTMINECTEYTYISA